MTTAPQTASAAIGNDERSDKTDDNGDRLCVLFFAMNGAGAGHAGECRSVRRSPSG